MFNMDTGHFAFAVVNGFDMSVHQPHPPGYFLYVEAARAITLIAGDPLLALSLMSVIATALYVPLIYIISDKVFGERAALAAGVLALTSPLLWLHGIVGLSYSVEALASAVLAWMALRSRGGETRFLWLSAVVLGLAGGFRQTTVVLMYPLWLYGAYVHGPRKTLLAHLVLAAGIAAWLFPMLSASGGLGGYLTSTASQVDRAVWNGLSLSGVAHNALLQFFSASWAVMAGLVPLLHIAYTRIRSGSPLAIEPADAKFILFWALPALAFYTIVISKSNNPGYALVYSGALYIAAGAAVSADSLNLAAGTNSLSGKRNVFLAYLTVIALINTALFFGLKFNFSYRGMSENNKTSQSYIREIKSRFSPKDTIVVGGESFFVSYRHAAWYIPEFKTVYLFPILTPDGGYYITSFGRDSRKDKEVPIPDTTHTAVYFGNIKHLSGEDVRHIKGAHLIDTGNRDRLLYFDLSEFDDLGTLADIIRHIERGEA